MIDLFRPRMNDTVLQALEPILSYHPENGRMYIGEGARVQEFENEFQRFVGLKHKVLALNSGTSALELAGMLIGLKEDDEVISTPITCFATFSPILLAKAKIVWADVDPWTGLIDIDDVLKKITPKTKAIITVSWGGQPIDHSRLKPTGIPIIFDDAHGSYYADPDVDYICYSTQAIKFLTTVDGGLLYLPKDQYDKGRLLRWYGLDRLNSAGFRCGEQSITLPGRKLHMNDVNATIGLENIKILRETVVLHYRNAHYYSKSINNKYITVPRHRIDSYYWLYTIFAKNRDGLKQYLSEHGIESSLVHARNDKHAIFAYAQTDLPGVTQFNDTQLSIPVGWWLSHADLKYISDTLNAWRG